MLSLIVWTPILGVFLIYFLANSEINIKRIALTCTGIPLLLSIILAFRFNPQGKYQFVERFKWIKNLGIDYYLGIDGLSLGLVILVGILTFIVIFSINTWEHRKKAFFCCLLIMESGLLGVFTSLDLILFYVFWEIVLIPGYFLIYIWGGKERQKASIKFLIYTLLGSLVMLIAILAVYFKANLNTFSIPDLATVNFPVNFQKVIFIFLLVGLAIKIPLFPFHSWLPDAYVEAPNLVTVLFSGLLAKMGAYGFIRLAYSLVPEGLRSFSWLVSLLAVFTVIYATLCASAQKDLKKMFAYSSLGHMGLIMLGIGAFNRIGLNGSIFYMLNHGLIAGGIFLLITIIYEATGTLEINKINKLATYLPLGIIPFWFFLLASFGLPGTGGFIAELYVLIGAFQSNVAFGILAGISTIIVAGYIFPTLSKLSFKGDTYNQEGEKTRRQEDKKMSIGGQIKKNGLATESLAQNRTFLSLYILGIIILILGFYPGIFIKISNNYINFLATFTR
ncbi:MAG: NADH-quinone oxidoreductase subunit M [bacterium]